MACKLYQLNKYINMGKYLINIPIHEIEFELDWDFECCD